MRQIPQVSQLPEVKSDQGVGRISQNEPHIFAQLQGPLLQAADINKRNSAKYDKTKKISDIPGIICTKFQLSSVIFG